MIDIELGHIKVPQRVQDASGSSSTSILTPLGGDGSMIPPSLSSSPSHRQSQPKSSQIHIHQNICLGDTSLLEVLIYCTAFYAKGHQHCTHDVPEHN
ncbi:hypothetical protein Hypma_013752 [Hypsizygus marmoreus]|uniref:Uncharacterized protein n=1 Tax=Hypsizygus marmoreus TaxID=39966 RepID=A0A369K900_HYPMA|nr:hypothetical protein Hypma_013752 [Hypsizygus marmoreus]